MAWNGAGPPASRIPVSCHGDGMIPGRVLAFWSTMLLLSAPQIIEAQHPTRWFTEFGFGHAAMLSEADAWSGTSSAHAAIGLTLGPTLSARVALNVDNLRYDVARLTALFPEDSITRSRVRGQLVGGAASFEWAYPWFGVVRPTAGLGMSYLHRKVLGFPASPQWYRCVFQEDGRSPPGCEDFMKDLQTDGSGLGLIGSAGIDFALRGQDLGFHIRLAKGVVENTSGLVSAQFRYRLYFR